MEAFTDTQLRFIGICAVLLTCFGIPYAIMIARKAFEPHLTWLSVAIGDFVTDLGTGAMLLLLTGNPVLACLPLFNHILTGGPMIAGQIIKHNTQRAGNVGVSEDD